MTASAPERAYEIGFWDGVSASLLGFGIGTALAGGVTFGVLAVVLGLLVAVFRVWRSHRLGARMR